MSEESAEPVRITPLEFEAFSAVAEKERPTTVSEVANILPEPSRHNAGRLLRKLVSKGLLRKIPCPDGIDDRSIFAFIVAPDAMSKRVEVIQAIQATNNGGSDEHRLESPDGAQPSVVADIARWRHGYTTLLVALSELETGRTATVADLFPGVPAEWGSAVMGRLLKRGLVVEHPPGHFHAPKPQAIVKEIYGNERALCSLAGWPAEHAKHIDTLVRSPTLEEGSRALTALLPAFSLEMIRARIGASDVVIQAYKRFAEMSEETRQIILNHDDMPLTSVWQIGRAAPDDQFAAATLVADYGWSASDMKEAIRDGVDFNKRLSWLRDGPEYPETDSAHPETEPGVHTEEPEHPTSDQVATATLKLAHATFALAQAIASRLEAVEERIEFLANEWGYNKERRDGQH